MWRLIEGGGFLKIEPYKKIVSNDMVFSFLLNAAFSSSARDSLKSDRYAKYISIIARFVNKYKFTFTRRCPRRRRRHCLSSRMLSAILATNILTIILPFLARNCVLNGPEMLNFSAIFLVASFTCKTKSEKFCFFKGAQSFESYKRSMKCLLLSRKGF